jgi:hypothetical protein
VLCVARITLKQMSPKVISRCLGEVKLVEERDRFPIVIGAPQSNKTSEADQALIANKTIPIMVHIWSMLMDLITNYYQRTNQIQYLLRLLEKQKRNQ